MVETLVADGGSVEVQHRQVGERADGAEVVVRHVRALQAEAGEAEVPGLAGTGFYDRWSKGEGQFLLPGEVARHPARFTQQLFRELTYVRIVPSERGPGTDRVLVASHTPRRGINFCEPWIYVDDRLIELMPGEGLEDAVPRSTVEAIEVYMYPFGPPMRYFRDLMPETACGAILICVPTPSPPRAIPI